MASTRTIAIGDVHGYANPLASLLGTIAPTSEDTIVMLGDYIDHGPQSNDVLDLLLHLRDRCHLVTLLGNHEQMLLAAKEGRDDLRYWLRHGGEATLRSYGTTCELKDLPWSHLQFIRGCKLFYETESHIFVHANCDPTKPMVEQNVDCLLWRHFRATETTPHYTGKTMVLGHTPQDTGEILDLGHAMCVDTGCGYGGPLTAIDVVAGTVWKAET